MKRRDFLKGLGIGAAATAIPASALTHAEQLVKQNTVKPAVTVQSNAIEPLWPGIDKWYTGDYATISPSGFFTKYSGEGHIQAIYAGDGKFINVV